MKKEYRLLSVGALLGVLLFPIVCSANLVSLTSKDGRTIQAEIVARENERVKVKREDGREFYIPFDLLDERSLERVKNWTDPEGLLFSMLDDVIIYDEDFWLGSNEELENNQLLIELSKAYGTYEKFTSSGRPNATLSLAGLLFALDDFQYQKNCGLVIDEYDENLFGEMVKIKGNWPQGLSSMSLSNFEEFLEELYSLNSRMEREDRYFISPNVRSHANSLLFIIRDYKSSLGGEK